MHRLSRLTQSAILLTAVLSCGGGGESDRPDATRADTVSDAARPEAAGEPTDTAARRADAGTARAAPSYRELRRQLCDTIPNSFDCARTIEDRRLPVAEGVERQGDTLLLSLSSGDTLRLADRSGGDHSARYYFSYQDRWPDRGYYLLQKQYYEGSAFLLVDDSTGSTTTLADWPLRTSDGRRFAVLSLDLVAGYGPNTLQIWDFEGGSPTRQWETEPSQWGPVDGSWVGSDTLRFVQHGFCGELGGSGRQMCDRPAVLIRSGGAWHLQTGHPRAP